MKTIKIITVKPLVIDFTNEAKGYMPPYNPQSKYKRRKKIVKDE